MTLPNILDTLDMASRRSLGGGRVLGSGRNLSPAVSPRPQAQHNRNPSFLSPSESSMSLSSQTSNSPASTAETKEDISSRVLSGPSENAAASASSRLVCPICNEEMVGH
jgi:rabenosyn-5